jgi:hypothetical protein
MQTYQLAEAHASEPPVRRVPARAVTGGNVYSRLTRHQVSSSQYTHVPKSVSRLALASQEYKLKEPTPDRFSEYEAYEVDDWDGYGAEPIHAATVAWARSFFNMLPRGHLIPDVAPGADGTIGFEWAINQGNERQFIYVDVGPTERFRARRMSSDGALIDELPVVGVDGLFQLVERIAPLLR